MKKNTRFRSRWRIDQDYRRKLAPDERAWLDQFNSEYYRAEFGDEPLHSDTQRLAIYAADNAAKRDIVTTCGEAVLKRVAHIKMVRRPVDRQRYYLPDDYAMMRRPAEVGSSDDDPNTPISQPTSLRTQR